MALFGSKPPAPPRKPTERSPQSIGEIDSLLHIASIDAQAFGWRYQTRLNVDRLLDRRLLIMASRGIEPTPLSAAFHDRPK